MCVMSAVMDYGRTRIPPLSWTPDSFVEFKQILDRLDALDKKLGEPECHDPAKALWMRDVERRLKALESPSWSFSSASPVPPPTGPDTLGSPLAISATGRG